MFKNLMRIMMICAFLLAGCAKPEPTITPLVVEQGAVEQQTAEQPAVSGAEAARLAAAYELAECPERGFRGGSQANVECGLLSVPLDRSKPEGEKLKIGVTVIKSSSAGKKKDPIVFISSAEGSRFTGFGFFFRNMIPDRDMIMVDPRGIGSAQPALECPGVAQVYRQNLDKAADAQEVLDGVQQAQEACYQQWVMDGVDFAALNGAASAADLEDLRQALGYGSWNVYASGSAARLALLLMRDYPQGVRSVILDSPGPLTVEAFAGQAGAIERALNLFFEGCAQDEKCGQAFPELKKVFYEVVDQLNTSPVTLEVADLNAGARYTILVDGKRLMDIMVRAVSSGGSTSILPELPRTIYQMKNGVYENLAKLLGGMASGLGSTGFGMQNFMYCTEVMTPETQDRAVQVGGQVEAHVREYYVQQAGAYLASCAVFKDLELPKSSFSVAASDIPTLIVGNTWNPGAATEWGKEIGGMLSRATVVEINGGGGDCSRNMTVAFLADPTGKVDTSCAGAARTMTWITLP